MAGIYALYSTRDGRVRYVGQSGNCAFRFKEHRRSAEWSSQSPLLDRWFHQEWRDGYLVRYALLEVCDKRDEAETRWISRFPWSDLLNQRKQPWTAVRKPPVVPEIVSNMRGHIFNVNGFRGVHYARQWDCYRVLVYNGYRVWWLEEGDELPWGSESIWFSDLNRAVNARDRFYRALRGRPAVSWHRTKLPLLRISLLMNARRQEDIIASRARYEERIRTEQGGYDYAWD